MSYSKQALDDITQRNGWVGTMAVAALVQLVPVLAWNNYGFFLNWSKEIAAGKDTPLPSYKVNGENFKAGFFVFLIGVIAGIATAIVGGILGLAPIIGGLLSLCAGVFVGLFSSVMTMRYAASGAFGDAFKLKDCWAAFTKRPAGLIEAVYLPALIVGIIASILLAIVIVALCTLLFGSLYFPSLRTDGLFISGAIFETMVLALVAWIFVSVAMALAMGVTFRALGRWTFDAAPQWTGFEK